MTRFVRILVVLSTLPAMLAGLMTGENVLCMSKSHVAIEPLCTSSTSTLQRPVCCADAADEHPFQSTAVSSPDTCGRCIDLPGLRSPIPSANINLDPPSQQPALALMPCPAAALAEPLIAERFLPVPDILAPSNTGSLTTILLI